jgi:hypothetical protein
MVVKLKPTWESKTKPARDNDGWRRGAIGVDGAYDLDGKDFCKTFDPKADTRIYGSDTRGQRADGAQRVMSNAAKDPGTITNRENDGTAHGYDGVDE